ncbi:MAG: glycoside hydrolase family 43 protein [Muribaculaceae bacterium]|nr:glycoside hydrolase family 43 protein [Muribaculaceae bacterium]
MKLSLTTFSLGAVLIPLLASCSNSTAKTIEPEKSAALFSCFEYTGNDKGYDLSELTDPGEYFNPIFPGWFSDPSICTNGEGDYFLCTSTFTYYPGVPLFHSRDLINWQPAGYILDRPSQLVNMEKQHVSGGIFAPAISYNPANKTYYMITTNVGAGNFFVKTQNPFGEWSDPIMLPEVQGIDPSFFFDEDGKAYIINNDDAPDGKPEYPGHRTVRIIQFDPETDKCIGERKIIVNKGVKPEEKPIWCEGPHIFKNNGKYYLMTAEGGTSTWHSEVIYRGDNPFGPFVPWQGNPILTQRHLPENRENPVTCAGHADIIQTPEGEWWGVFLACRPVDNNRENLGRETFLLQVNWTEDGWPVILPSNEKVPLKGKRAGVTRKENVTFGNFVQKDEFNDTVLPHHWFTLRGPAKEYYSLSQHPGYLTLKCGDVKSTEKRVLPMVARRIQHHDFTATTNMIFHPENDAQCAGLLVFKDETHQYFLTRCKKGEEHFIELRKISDSGCETLANSSIKSDTDNVDLQVKGKGLKFEFSYSTDGGTNWQPIGDSVDGSFTSTALAGGFTGTVLGLYASNVEVTDQKDERGELAIADNN